MQEGNNMTLSLRRAVLAAVFALAPVVAGVTVAGPAEAQPVTSGSLSFSGDPGDYITGGLAYSYSTDAGDVLSVSSNTDNSVVLVALSGSNGDWWNLDFAAPSGQNLAPGTYTGATRYPFNGAGPGLALYGNGRGCNEVTGSFTVLNAVYGPYGYVQTFDATFEQHCEGLDPAARGEVHIANPAAPPALTFAVAVAADGTASTLNGDVTVHGTVTCDKPTTVTLAGTVTEIVKKVLVKGTFSTNAACTPDAAASWTASATPTGTTPFQKGAAEVDVQAQGYDTDYGRYASTSTTATVTLRKE
jgi:hypothetical protein